jgi:hypothetical protein
MNKTENKEASTSALFDPSMLMLRKARDGLYESFYFRGNSSDDTQAFLLKHNFLRRHGERGVRVEITVVAFNRRTGVVHTAQDFEELSQTAFSHQTRGQQWDAMSMHLASGTFFEITREKVRGRLYGAEGVVTWEFDLTRQNEVLYHFPHSRLYQLPLPRKKVLTRDISVQYQGALVFTDFAAEGFFKGEVSHNWGTEHAREYAYAACSIFPNESDVYFAGFTAQLALVSGLVKLPRLSFGALKYEGKWLYFNALNRSYQQEVMGLSDYQWSVILCNDDYRLEVGVDGFNPRIEPWVALNYEQPSGRRVVVKSTQFAHGHLKLFDSKSGTLIKECRSEAFSLETLQPDSVPLSRGGIGKL